MKHFLNQVRQTIIVENMLQPEESVLVGVSGGPDSVALLDVLHRLAENFRIEIGIAHLNHGLRGEASLMDAEFVKNLAADNHLPYYEKTIDIKDYSKKHGLSLEEAGRHVRYSFFKKTANKEGYDKIALAHHAEDNAESILMFFMRGSGPGGLSGIPPVRNGIIIRPFITATKEQIHHYLQSNQLAFVEDATNEDIRFLRNRIRHRLLPELKRDYNADIVSALNRLGNICRQEEAWLTSIINPLFAATLLPAQKEETNVLCLSTKVLKTLHNAVKRRIIRKAIGQVKGDLRRIQLLHIDAVIDRLEDNSANKSQNGWSLDLPECIRVNEVSDRLIIKKESLPLRTVASTIATGTQTTNYEYLLSSLDESVKHIHIAETGVTLKFEKYSLPVKDTELENKNIAFLDMDHVQFPLTIRNSREGDRFRPMGMVGTQKVKRFFINNRIASTVRRYIPLVISDREIIWIAGLRLNDNVKITSQTKRALKVEICLHNIKKWLDS